MNANLELSKAEHELILNSDFILTKNRIIEKIYTLFGNLSEDYKSKLNEYSLCLPTDVFKISPKIYKGEQYRNLPYVMLDYPRCFSKTNVFAIRSFFWWGNYFSITLQLSGDYLKVFAGNVFKFIIDNKNKDWFIGINNSEWEHHFEKDNYIPFEELKDLDFSEFTNRTSIKIAKKIMLGHWQSVAEFYRLNYQLLIGCLCESASQTMK